jgi:hypothetical protein
MKALKIISLLLAVWLFAGCYTEKETIQPPVPSTLSILDDIDAQEKIFLAFASAYPNKIKSVEIHDGDWSMMVNGTRIYFANGRFLPAELRDQWEKYLPYDFYQYPWEGTAKERRVAFDNPLNSVGSSFLFDALYLSPSEDDSWDLQVKYSFLGVKMLVHSHVSPLLDRVAAQIRATARNDKSINEWIAELQTAPPTFGWNWRTIAGTNRRSNHSYGIAIDLLPRNLRGRHTYWQWGASEQIDRNTYYIPPDSVIKIFEDNGFIWGGKWDLIDTMHFEYRPEMLILNDYTVNSIH